MAFVGLGSDNYFDGTDENHLRDFYRLDPSTDTWTKIGDFPIAGRLLSTSFVVSNEAYVAGGHWGKDLPYGNLKVTAECWKYNIDGDSWEQVANLPYASGHSKGLVVANTGYVYLPIGYAGQIYKYENNTWVLVKSISMSARYLTAFSINDLIYLGLGLRSQISGTRELWELDIETGQLMNRPIDYYNERYGATSFVVGERAYIIGQMTSGRDVWEFDPSRPN
jgi:N-acetylneuraminic acid mutarotase